FDLGIKYSPENNKNDPTLYMRAFNAACLEHGLINVVVDVLLDNDTKTLSSIEWDSAEEVSKLRMEMRLGKVIDPITIYRQADDRLAIADGRLAYLIAKELKWPYISAVVLKGIDHELRRGKESWNYC
ncbi:MAG: hypothetical protein ACXABY_04945, partial [Candidatus Thorarchaeota archaeon]